MRSRYTAFALGDRHHLLVTWHPSERPARLELDEGLQWRALRIVETAQGRSGDRRGIVEFCARWRDSLSGTTGELRERSRFVWQDGRWWYVDGVVESP
jgi:SEC-C motif-containing protein